jgi:glycosyltransferase involved in cell wall biosynthesis
VVGNGVDTGKFHPVDRDQARRSLGIPDTATVLISVGGLTERKGFHRVIELLPALRSELPGLLFLIVGGASAEGDWGPQLRQQVRELGLEDCVRFLGTLPPEALKHPLSAADVFVLATRNEGWANVFLEAMACGLPVITTDVGGNREVVCRDELGAVVPFGDAGALRDALSAALARDWDRAAIVGYARDNEWDGRVAALVAAFRALHRKGEVGAAEQGVGEVG